MSQPVPYVPVTSFLAYQSREAWFPGQNIDAELNALKATTDQIRTNLALIQRDDGALKNAIVTYDSLSAAVKLMLGVAPFAAGIRGVDVAVTPTGGLLSTNAQAALEEVFAATHLEAAPRTGGVAILGTITPGTGYANGTYTPIQLHGGTGTGATATITVAGGVVTAASILSGGINYTFGDSLTALAADIGGTGSGFAVQAGVGNSYIPASGLPQGFYHANVGNADNTRFIPNTKFDIPGIGPLPAAGQMFLMANYADSSPGNISNLYAVAINSGKRYTAAVTGVGVNPPGTVGGNVWGGQFSAIANGNANTVLNGANIEVDWALDSTGTFIALQLVSGVGDDRPALTHGLCYITCTSRGVNTAPIYGWRLQATETSPININGAIIQAEGNLLSAKYGIDLRNCAFSSYAYSSPGFTVDGAGNIIATSFSGALTVTSLSGTTINGAPRLGFKNLTGTADVGIISGETNTASRAVSLNVNDASRVINLSGDLSLAANFSTSGANALTLTTTASSNVTLPTTGTLATRAGTETFTNKTLTSPSINSGDIHSSANLGVTNGSFEMLIAPTGGSYTANRTLSFNLNDANKTVNLSGSLSLPAVAQGDLWFGSASGAISALAKDTGTSRFLKNSGTSNNPAWVQPAASDLSNGTTGTGTVMLSSVVRAQLTTNQTYYVRTDGSDSNTGLANTSGGAFLTIQKAINTVGMIDLSIYNVTIQVADGTYTGAITASAPWVGFGTVTLQGNTTTPANAIISPTSATAISVSGGCVIYLKGFKITTTTSGNAIFATDRGVVNIAGLMEYGAVAAGWAHIGAASAGYVNVTANYTISGNAGSHFSASARAQIAAPGITVTLTGTPAFSTFASASNNGLLNCPSVTFSGSATGSRYSVSNNATIDTGAAGVNYFPGNAVGAGTNAGTTPYGLYN